MSFQKKIMSIFKFKSGAHGSHGSGEEVMIDEDGNTISTGGSDAGSVSGGGVPPPPQNRSPSNSGGGAPQPPHHPHKHKSGSHHHHHKKRASGSASGGEDSGHDSDVGSEHDTVKRPPHRTELDHNNSNNNILASPPIKGSSSGSNSGSRSSSPASSANRPLPASPAPAPVATSPAPPTPAAAGSASSSSGSSREVIPVTTVNSVEALDSILQPNHTSVCATPTGNNLVGISHSASFSPNSSMYEKKFSYSSSMQNVLATMDAESRRQYAISKIQRQARKKNALRAAHAEQQWKMFADLDTQDEAEMLHLAVFMQTLLEVVPKAQAMRPDPEELKSNLMINDDVIEDIVHEQSAEDMEACIRLDAIKVTAGKALRRSSFSPPGNTLPQINPEGPNVIDFSHREVDMNFVADIIQIFRNNTGKLSKNTVMKILRRVYKILLKLPNVTKLSVTDKCKLTVVGDLHGQLPDLLYILDECGLPGPNNKFIFNGDFVDRGEKGLEIVCILFAMMVAAGPEVVALNRGNHEDLPVCRVYGFEGEVKEKYDELLFEMFAEVFNHLPLFAIIDDSVFVVHGGLFHNPNVTMNDLEQIVRTDYFVKPPIPYPQNITGLSSEEARYEYLKQLQRDALWSDPTDETGCFLNPRGAGVTFGPDIAQQFMEVNDFWMVVRSHECCYRGFELPYSIAFRQQTSMLQSSFYLKAALSHANSPANLATLGGDEDYPVEDEPLLGTLFSASNYIGGDNEGAILQFMTHPFSGSHPVYRPKLNKRSESYRNLHRHNLHYGVKRYKTTEACTNIEDSNRNSLTDLILRKKSALTSAFEACDPNNTGHVTRFEWAEIMLKITNIKIRWLSIISTVAPPACLTPMTVDYRAFLQSFTLESKYNLPHHPKAALAMDDMYGQRKQLETVFYFFDTNGDGVISREEFRDGCALLNKSLHPDCQLTDIDRTLDVMDFDGSGTIDINEFFETFRILDAKDGKVDGIISLAKGLSKKSR